MLGLRDIGADRHERLARQGEGRVGTVHVLVYLPLAVSLLAACTVRWLAERLEPRLATWLFTASAVLLFTSTCVALGALAAELIGQYRPIATLGQWSVRTLRRDNPESVLVEYPAAILLPLVLAVVVGMTANRLSALRAVARTVRRLPVQGELALLADSAPQAYAAPGPPGRIVVSTGMLQSLTALERRALLAHERAHLEGCHHRFVILTQIVAAANPVLRPFATAVSYTVERWADEHAARAVADREAVARTISKCALVSRARPGPGRSVALSVGGPRLGPVPRRVAALSAPPRHRASLVAVLVVVLLVAAVSALQTCWDVDVLFDLARQAHLHP
jgi:hypothetical protein